MMQRSLFDDPNLASMTTLAPMALIPPAPTLVPHAWPFPGMTPEDSARAAVANSDEYRAMLAAVIQPLSGCELTGEQVLAMVPDDWRALCGRFAHGRLDFRHGLELGILVKYVPHDDGGFHFSYQANRSA